MKLLRARELFEVFPLHWVLLVSPLLALQDSLGWVRGSVPSLHSPGLSVSSSTDS